MKNFKAVMKNFGASLAEKYKSPIMWTATASFISLLIQQIWGFDVSDRINDILTPTLSFMVLLGILNNPNDPEGI